MTLRLPPEMEDRLKHVAETQHRSVQQAVLVANEETFRRATPPRSAETSALRGLADAREAERASDVVYGTDAARALLAERRRRLPTPTTRDHPPGAAAYSELLPEDVAAAAVDSTVPLLDAPNHVGKPLETPVRNL